MKKVVVPDRATENAKALAVSTEKKPFIALFMLNLFTTKENAAHLVRVLIPAVIICADIADNPWVNMGAKTFAPT